MSEKLKNCWEILECKREKGGSKVAELGECIVSVRNMGHSCWAIAGTFCGGEVQGTAAKKYGGCLRCSVYQLYNRMTGTQSDRVKLDLAEENEKLSALLGEDFSKLRKKAG
ncbi:hypothetical protein KAI87_15755 [Myxococcota bacterium]|nr:hypothetical protein [Myxococcota bacterium]